MAAEFKLKLGLNQGFFREKTSVCDSAGMVEGVLVCGSEVVLEELCR